MKKNGIYIGFALIVGLVMGYFIFGETSIDNFSQDHQPTTAHTHQQWTCSMHPQIRQPTEGDCPICKMDLIPVSSGTDYLLDDQFRMSKNAMALANIQTSVIRSTAASSSGLTIAGKIIENQATQSVQVTHFSGRIEKLYIKTIGESIKKGQLLAMIYSPELVVAQQELLTAISLKSTQPSLYKAVRNKLRIRKITEDQIDQIEAAGKIKEVFPVYAHFSGIVTKKMMEEGDHVSGGQVLYHLSDLNTVWASFDVYEHQIPFIQEGQKIKITTTAYPTIVYDTKIVFIDPVISAATRTVKVRAVVSNRNQKFKPGMFIEGMIPEVAIQSDTTILVPKSAVLWTGKRSILYVKTSIEESVFQLREVVLGGTKGNDYLIESGVAIGEEIVTNGTFTVDAAAQLLGKQSMMSYKKKDSLQKHDGAVLSMAFQEKFVADLRYYFEIKDALVASDEVAVRIHAKQWLEKIKSIQSVYREGLEKTLLEQLVPSVSLIANNQSLLEQRKGFVLLNKDILPLMKHINSRSTILYVQECPMANHNQGATWLSKEKDIKNPYFGDTMLSCGSVSEVLSKS